MERKHAKIMAKRSPPDPIYVLRGTEAAINVVKFAPKPAREEGLLLSGSVRVQKWTFLPHSNIMKRVVPLQVF